MKKTIIFIIFIILVQSIYSHGGDNSSKLENRIIFNESEEIQIWENTISNWEFSSTRITIDSQKNNRLIYMVDSGHHGISIPELDLETGNMTEGEFVIWDIVGYPKGEYPFFCNIPCGEGHREMRGTIIIE